jgi:hypothetical protein
MSDNKDTLLLSLQEQVASQEKVINLLAQALADHAIILTTIMQRCDEHDCTKAATWINVVNGIHMCDKCCKQLTADAVKHGASKLNVEEEWEEVANAKSIRFIDTHASLVSSALAQKRQKAPLGNDFN